MAAKRKRAESGGERSRGGRRPLPRAWVLAGPLLAAAWFLIPACKEERVSIVARRGDPCTSCEDCEGYFISNCGCDECFRYAYEPETMSMLRCIDGRFEVESCCPGGGEVTCKDSVRSQSCFSVDASETFTREQSCLRYRCGCGQSSR